MIRISTPTRNGWMPNSICRSATAEIKPLRDSANPRPASTYPMNKIPRRLGIGSIALTWFRVCARVAATCWLAQEQRDRTKDSTNTLVERKAARPPWTSISAPKWLTRRSSLLRLLARNLRERGSTCAIGPHGGLVMEATTAARLADYMYIWNSVCGWQLRRRGGGPLLSDSIGRWPTLALVDRTAIDEQRSRVRGHPPRAALGRAATAHP